MRAGKVRAIGASNFSAERLEAALAVSAANGLVRYECPQPPYNLLDREPFEGALAAACERHGIGVAGYCALAAGFLSGKYRRTEDAPGRTRAGRVKGCFDQRGWRVFAALDAAAQRTGSASAAVAIAGLLARPAVTAPIASATNPYSSVTAPIASATSVQQLDELLQGVELLLDEETLRQLDQAGAGVSP